MVNEEQTGQDPQTEPQGEDPTAERRAAQGDMRVPSNPLRPADIPPKPLTRAGYSETE